MTKLTFYGGSAVALLLLGYYAGKRHGSDLGSTGISSLDYAKNMPLFALKVAKQVGYAQAGKWITSIDQAEDSTTFSKPPGYDVRAHLTVAYWTAVAARLTKNRTLAARAAATLARANSLYSLPGSSMFTGSVSSIMQSGAATLRKAATSSRAQPAIDALVAAGDPEGVKAKQEQQQKDSLTGKALEYLSPEAAVKRALDDSPWWTWGKRIAGGAVLILGARWAYLKYESRKALPAPPKET